MNFGRWFKALKIENAPLQRISADKKIVGYAKIKP